MFRLPTAPLAIQPDCKFWRELVGLEAARAHTPHYPAGEVRVLHVMEICEVDNDD